MENYDDIIGLPHHQSETRPHMTLHDRAAQFAPFAALTGYGDSIQEKARYTDAKAEISPARAEELNEALCFLLGNAGSSPEAKVTYFRADGRKAGGKYVERVGIVKKVDGYRNALVFEDGSEVAFDDLYEIQICGKE